MEIKTGNGLNVLQLEGKYIDNVVIYDKGEVLFETKTGNFSVMEEGGTSKNCQFRGLKVEDVKRAVKLNLNRNDNFYIKTGCNLWNQNTYAIYLKNGLDVELIGTQELRHIQTKTETNYLTYGDVKFLNESYGLYDKLVRGSDEYVARTGYKFVWQETKGHRLLLQRAGYSRKEVSEFGLLVKEKTKQLQELFGDKICSYHVEKALETYDILITKKGEN